MQYVLKSEFVCKPLKYMFTSICMTEAMEKQALIQSSYLIKKQQQKQRLYRCVNNGQKDTNQYIWILYICHRLFCTFLYIPYNVPCLHPILTIIFNISSELPKLGR